MKRSSLYTLTQSLYGALAWVYNASDLPARDAVVTVYRIHTFPTPDVLRLTVAVSHAAEWPAAWKRGERLTGNPDVDSLVLRWGLTLDRYYSLSSLDFDLASLLAPRPRRATPGSSITASAAAIVPPAAPIAGPGRFAWPGTGR